MGSPNGLWTAVSGGMAQSQNVDIIANNLANANTAGFKKDVPTFKEYLTAVERPPNPGDDIPRTIYKDSDFYHFDGREHALVNLNEVHTDHSQGAMHSTRAPFDLAIDGPGFFAIKTPTGVMFTRNGDFKVNGEGILMTSDGYPVLAQGSDSGTATEAARTPANVNSFSATGGNTVGATAQLKPVVLKDALEAGLKIHITQQGEIFSGEEQVAKLALAEFADTKLLQKTTTNLYSNPDPANVPRISTASVVHQGFLESSNVNPVTELLDLLKANRMFESNMRAIKTYNDMAGKEANEVGKL